jgi:hypothetical protein
VRQTLYVMRMATGLKIHILLPLITTVKQIDIKS